MRETDTAALPGRRGQAARNNIVILDAARHVFLGDPKAPISQVAERAGVGISALYRRYPSKEALLRHICHDGLLLYIGEAEYAAEEKDGWDALTKFLTRVVEADVHSLTVHLAGTFTPTPEMGRDAQRAGELTRKLVERAHESGRLRPDVVTEDIGMILECCAAIRVDDPSAPHSCATGTSACSSKGCPRKGRICRARRRSRVR
ncbi:TetR/AcrR family transcriptional regulator [Amycolatopsis sp. Hca4]|uniref:TetR/AcrR family transcriptional regulator n=1 Tax=Amycolatopsis sp. Hca4 TaxID=2742131 RepID=UPI0020CB0A43|nr:TetR/AcrR family transcriptional regulator [Amycolatopsis sp. Hca4]